MAIDQFIPRYSDQKENSRNPNSYTRNARAGRNGIAAHWQMSALKSKGKLSSDDIDKENLKYRIN